MPKYNYDTVLSLLQEIGISEKYSGEFSGILDGDNDFLFYITGEDIRTDNKPISYYFSMVKYHQAKLSEMEENHTFSDFVIANYSAGLHDLERDMDYIIDLHYDNWKKEADKKLPLVLELLHYFASKIFNIFSSIKIHFVKYLELKD